MSEVTELWNRLRIFESNSLILHQALAACAYWAANGLATTRSPKYSVEIMDTMLQNILKESKEYAISEPGCDNNFTYEGFEYTYTPVGGWPDPRRVK